MFQFTRPRGARHEPCRIIITRKKFQFTRPRGARLPSFLRDAVRGLVSIHAPTGGATSTSRARTRRASFNSRAHGGRDRHSSPTAKCPTPFQFTRPRGARRQSFGVRAVLRPFQFTRPRGARHTLDKDLDLYAVSIHAPTGGATPIVWRTARRAPGFNSRAHGGRDSVGGSILADLAVSIHAPTGGATTQRPSLTLVTTAFQFTRPRGARQWHRQAICVQRCFNSRAHGGRDGAGPRSRSQVAVSIHAPTGGATRPVRTALWSRTFQFTRPRGARPVKAEAPNGDAVSIHAPTGGATQLRQFVFRDARVSIHAPTGGATNPSTRSCGLSKFQFTRPRGARPEAKTVFARAQVSIHAPTGGATGRPSPEVSR